jgi:phospholipid N-methyltransferase
MTFKQYITFFQQFIKHPKRVGSVIPSSRFLAKKMVQAVRWEDVQGIAELGSGTGAITRYIEPKVHEDTTVILFEMDDRMNRDLRTKYPNFTCHPNASYLIKVMKLRNIALLDCVLSGLPFFNFTSELRETLLNQILQALKPGGHFIAFQYSLQMKKLLAEKFIIESIDFVPLNFPPAFVYTCRKKEEL